MTKPRFKPYQQNQRFLFPPSLDDMVSANHPVRVVSESDLPFPMSLTTRPRANFGLIGIYASKEGLQSPFLMSLTALPCANGGLIGIYALFHPFEAKMFV